MRKRVLVFVTDFYKGGIASVCSNFLNEYTKVSNDEIALCVYDDKPFGYELPETVKVYHLKFPLWKDFGETQFESFKRSVVRIPAMPLALIKFLNVCRVYKPHVIIAHSSIINSMALLAKKVSKYLKKTKIIVVDHNNIERPATSIAGKMTAKVAIGLYRNTDLAIAISKTIAEKQHTIFKVEKNKIKYVPNAINIAQIETLKSEELDNDMEKDLFKNPVILNVGRLSPDKGQWHLIKAYNEMKKQGTKAKLVIIGEGELESELKELICYYGLENDVVMLGYKKNPYKYLAKSSIFAFSSISEGLPMSLLEAMSCGVPVISTDCISGPRDILAEQSERNEALTKPM
jgi:glycosyltransferase involved in cell wall biosynthesis